MTQFVLVPGAWLGAWVWARVLPLLRAQGHVAHAATLTGVGDRAHLLSSDIRLYTHVQDVLTLIACEDLDDVVLVGHSYAGVVITGVADVLLARESKVLKHLVYLDAVVPHPGESWSSLHSPETVAERVKAAARGGALLPPPDASLFGLTGADRDWVNRHQVPHPFRVYQDALSFNAERMAQLPRTFIDCTSPPLATIEPIRQRVRFEPRWNVVEMAAGHLPMVQKPKELADRLLALA